MKKMLFVAVLFFMMGGPRAQSIADARKMLYYERYDGAAHSLQSLLRTDPNNAEAWWLLTRVYLHDGKAQVLHDSLSRMPAAIAQQPFALCAYGQMFLAEHKKDSAAAYFTKALTITKEKDPLILLAIARAQQIADSTEAQYAVQLLTKAIKRDKRNPELYVALGNAYRKLQDGTGSYKAYQDALAQDSKYVDALYKLGKIFVSQNNAEMYLKYFNDAVAADPSYAPAWYELYYHYYFRDVNKAMDCLNHYIASADPGIRNDYLVTDLLYSSRKYDSAIDHARRLIDQQGKTSEPRLYKLIAYSYKELHDSVQALGYMKQYFSQQCDTGFVMKDYETMGEIYDEMNQPDSSVRYYVKAGNMEKDSLKRVAYCKKLAELYKKQKDYGNQALWLGKYYEGSPKATNLDLFNWGLAWYMAKEYPLADSIFGIYETKYPEQDFGYYWRARSDAAIDTAMATGMAIPQYMKLIEIDGKDSTNKTNRKHLIESYGYIAAYKANTQKDYTGAIDYFEKLLALDPANGDAQKYVAILKKNMSRMAAKSGTETKGGDERSADAKADK
ncbi:MAG TPA: tetratricopeptide repeat protein [Puia sp.]|jgi:tetratricopeptide (TPR) repeat protein